MAYQVFISFKRGRLDGKGLTRDYELAADLHRTLLEEGIDTFFSEKDLSSSAFRDEIDEALDKAQILIAVGTSFENLDSQNVKYEWRSFYDDLLGGYKKNGEIYTYLEGMKQSDLPRALRQRQSFDSAHKDELIGLIKLILDLDNKPVPEQKNVSMAKSGSVLNIVPSQVVEDKCKRIYNSLFKPLIRGKWIVTIVSILMIMCLGSQIVLSRLFKTNHSLRNACEITSVNQISVGDHLTFGTYEQDGDISNGAEPIEWRVLAVENGRALLITEKLLDYVQYDEKYADVTWENCTLRIWMNQIFYNISFDSIEQNKISETTNTNDDNPIHKSDGGNATKDKVFALSISEVKDFFSSYDSRIAFTTVYAHGKSYDVSDHSAIWWLRSPGSNNLNAASVSYTGEVTDYGLTVNIKGIAVRPAIWVQF